MKRVVVGIVLLFVLGGFSVYAVDMGLMFLFNYNLITENGQLKVDFENFSDIAYLGLFFDVPIERRVGFRFSGAVKFSEVPPGDAAVFYDKNIHWDGTIGPSVHLFGESQIDPYLQIGAGCAGAVFNDERYWNVHTRTQIVIFLHALAGLNVVVADAFVVGVSVRAIPYSFNPSPLKTYDQFPIAGNVTIGFRF